MPGQEKKHCFQEFHVYAERTFLPFFRRFFKTRFPPGLFILALKPCLFFFFYDLVDKFVSLIISSKLAGESTKTAQGIAKEIVLTIHL